MNATRWSCALLALLVSSTELSARGGNYHTEDRYNPQHISSLPAEIRRSILQRCSDPKALHPFASYSNDMKRIELHFEHFVCDSDGSYCGSSGCLHEVWSFGRGHYHLSRSYYAPAGDAPAW